MSDIILHHYDGSPFAHKIRLIFGLKNLAWNSVVIPMVMPKPDLMPLTGGFRRTPVMQIGADVYCDTILIADEIERRHPEPTLYPSGGAGMAQALTGWSDANLFMPATNFVFSNIADKLPAGLLPDRAAMRGAQPPDIEKMKAAGPRLMAQTKQQLDLIEDMLDDGRPYLLGQEPGLADFAVMHPVWMISNGGRRNAAALEPYPKILAWLARLNDLGTGDRTEIDSKASLNIAKSSEPAVQERSEEIEGTPVSGTKVAVHSVDRVPEAVVGELVHIETNRMTIRREDPAVGWVHIHFPRIGYFAKELL